MTAEALVSRQLLGWPRNHPSLIKGAGRVAAHLEKDATRNIYYWYYATQLLHNLKNKDWEKWNPHVREELIKTQVNDDTCASGSWDPSHPSSDQWGEAAGRLFQTSLSILTLEVYYRYLPLYRTADTEGGLEADAGRRAGQEEGSTRAGASRPGQEHEVSRRAHGSRFSVIPAPKERKIIAPASTPGPGNERRGEPFKTSCGATWAQPLAEHGLPRSHPAEVPRDRDRRALQVNPWREHGTQATIFRRRAAGEATGFPRSAAGGSRGGRLCLGVLGRHLGVPLGGAGALLDQLVRLPRAASST